MRKYEAGRALGFIILRDCSFLVYSRLEVVSIAKKLRDKFPIRKDCGNLYVDIYSLHPLYEYTSNALVEMLNICRERKVFYKSATHIVEMCNILARRACYIKKLPSIWTRDDIDDFICYLSEEIYILFRTRKDIPHYYNYVLVGFYGYVEGFMKLMGMDTPKYNDKATACFNPARALRHSAFDLESITNKDTTAVDVKKLFQEWNLKLQSVHIFDNPVSRSNARISIDLSLKYGKFISFRLNEHDEMMARFLYNKFRMQFQKLVDDKHRTIISDEHYLRYIACEIRGDFDDEEDN